MNDFRTRLYADYASATGTETGNEEAVRLIYRRELRRLLPADPHRRRILDIGCGQGALCGYSARTGSTPPVSTSVPNRSAWRINEGCGPSSWETFTSTSGRGNTFDAILALDVLEHQVKGEVLQTFDEVQHALRPGGCFIARVPNAVSPTGGNIMFGDLTHETWFTRRSIAQLAAVAGFAELRTSPCPPVAHGLRSALRVMVWKPISGLVKLALVAETGRLRGHIITQNLTFVAVKPGPGGCRCRAGGAGQAGLGVGHASCSTR